jgi:hypothetical protein
MGWLLVALAGIAAVVTSFVALVDRFDCGRPDCALCGSGPHTTDPAVGPDNRKATP